MRVGIGGGRAGGGGAGAGDDDLGWNGFGASCVPQGLARVVWGGGDEDARGLRNPEAVGLGGALAKNSFASSDEISTTTFFLLTGGLALRTPFPFSSLTSLVL